MQHYPVVLEESTSNKRQRGGNKFDEEKWNGVPEVGYPVLCATNAGSIPWDTRRPTIFTGRGWREPRLW